MVWRLVIKPTILHYIHTSTRFLNHSSSPTSRVKREKKKRMMETNGETIPMMETPGHEIAQVSRCNSCDPQPWSNIPSNDSFIEDQPNDTPDYADNGWKWTRGGAMKARIVDDWIDVKWIITRLRRKEEFSRWADPGLTEIDGSNHGSVFRHSSDHVRPRLSPVYLDTLLYPRKSLGHDALNEYLRCADRSWYPEATIGRNVSINNNGRSLRGIPGPLGTEKTTTTTPRRRRRG